MKVSVAGAVSIDLEDGSEPLLLSIGDARELGWELVLSLGTEHKPIEATNTLPANYFDPHNR